jgi:hypothetical protein
VPFNPTYNVPPTLEKVMKCHVPTVRALLGMVVPILEVPSVVRSRKIPLLFWSNPTTQANPEVVVVTCEIIPLHTPEPVSEDRLIHISIVKSPAPKSQSGLSGEVT